MIEHEVLTTKKEELQQSEEQTQIRREINKLMNKKQTGSVSFGLPKMA
jgi:hypothetical protein